MTERLNWTELMWCSVKNMLFRLVQISVPRFLVMCLGGRGITSLSLSQSLCTLAGLLCVWHCAWCGTAQPVKKVAVLIIFAVSPPAFLHVVGVHTSSSSLLQLLKSPGQNNFDIQLWFLTAELFMLRSVEKFRASFCTWLGYQLIA